MAKYDSLRKLQRNAWLHEFALAHPNMSMEEIGEIFGLTRQRVWQILRAGRGGAGGRKPGPQEE